MVTLTPEENFFARLSDAGKVAQASPLVGGVEQKTDPAPRSPLSLRNLFMHHDTHPVVLDFALIREFQLEWLKWEPETLWASIDDLFKSVVSEHNRQKILAVQTLHVSQAPWEKWQVFEKVCQALNNNIPRFDVMQVPSLDQLYAGVDIMDTIRREPFNDEVKNYMAAAVLNEDVFFTPAPLEFIQMEVSRPFYKCKDCGQTFNALFHDGICDTCTQKFDPEQGLSMRPKQELLEAGFGKNMETGRKFDPEPVQKRWEEVKARNEKDFDIQETQVDIQVAKLLVARDYVNLRRKQLADQLVALKSWLGA